MDFAPVLDVNTNQHNPIIGIRSFSNNADEVITHSKAVINELQLNNIIPVGKHFPGHGEAWVDSHLEMPVIDLEKQELEETHIKPFKQAVQNGLDAIMVAHVHYTAFDKDEIPASLSKNVITQYLRKELGFDGLIISDDMVMGGIANSFSKVDAIIKGINAGINLFIFRDSYSTTLKSIDMLVSAIEKEAINVDQINESVLRILKIKEKYGILEQNAPVYPEINISDCQKEIDFMATKSITVVKSGKELPLDKTKKYCILTPNKSQIFNYSFDKGFLSQFLDGLQREELIYSLNPDNDEIQQLLKSLETFDAVIFVSYNALFNQNQISLFNSIQKPVIAISAGIPYDSEFYNRADSILHSYCYKTPSLKALASVMINP